VLMQKAAPPPTHTHVCLHTYAPAHPVVVPAHLHDARQRHGGVDPREADRDVHHSHDGHRRHQAAREQHKRLRAAQQRGAHSAMGDVVANTGMRKQRGDHACACAHKHAFTSVRAHTPTRAKFHAQAPHMRTHTHKHTCAHAPRMRTHACMHTQHTHTHAHLHDPAGATLAKVSPNQIHGRFALRLLRLAHGDVDLRDAATGALHLQKPRASKTSLRIEVARTHRQG